MDDVNRGLGSALLQPGHEQRFRAFVMATSDAIYLMSADWAEMCHLEGESVHRRHPRTVAHLAREIHPP